MRRKAIDIELKAEASGVMELTVYMVSKANILHGNVKTVMKDKTLWHIGIGSGVIYVGSWHAKESYS